MRLFSRIARSLARRRSWRHLSLAVTLVAALSATVGCGDSSADVAAGDLVTTVPLAGGDTVRAVAKSGLTDVVRRAAALNTSVLLLSSALDAIPEPGTKG